MSDQPTAEDRYRTAEARLFAATGTRAVSRMVRVRERWTHLIEAGSDRPVVLVHGGPVAVTWTPLMSLLQDYLHLYAPDRPGCGLTDKPSYRGVALRRHATDFVEVLLDSLGLERVSLVGGDMGAYWALAFALANPDRVQRLVLLGTPAGAARRPPLGDRVRNAPVVASFLDAFAPGPNRRRMAARLGRGAVSHPDRLAPALLDALYAAAVLPGTRRSQVTLRRSTTPTFRTSQLAYALRDELAKLSVPALFVWGERDRSPLKWTQELCELLPNARLEVVPDAGSMVWLDEPDRVAALLKEFLGTRLSVQESRQA